jgi:hypothetical protein
MIIIGKINDPRLTPDMERSRSGSVQHFHKKGHVDWHNPFIVVSPPERHIYAELIDGEWHWVNGCIDCNDDKKGFSYIKCVKHDVCLTCGIPRDQLKETPWGAVNGFNCKPCVEKEDAAIRAAALQRAEENEKDSLDYYRNDKITCPYCDAEFDESERYDADGEQIECHECGNTFALTANHEVTWTMTKIKEKTGE